MNQLHIIVTGSAVAVRALINAGANVNAINSNLMTPLHTAIVQRTAIPTEIIFLNYFSKVKLKTRFGS